MNLHLGLAIVADKSGKFSNLLVFMEQSTHIREIQFARQFCGDAFESWRFLRIFGRAGKAGSDKNLAWCLLRTLHVVL